MQKELESVVESTLKIYLEEINASPLLTAEQEKELAVPLLAYRVTVNVDWEHAGRTRQITLRSVRLKQVERTGG